MSTFQSAIVGFAVADAFGVPVEFEERDTYQITDMLGFRSWNVPAGSWSDDSAMMFCTMEHLLEGTSLDHLKEKFCDWAYRGYWTHDGEPTFDIGATISEVVHRWELKGYHEKARTDAYSNGNGALMRILPIALWTWKKELTDEQLFSFVESYATVTHGHIRSTIACYHYVYVVHELLNGTSIVDSLQTTQKKIDERLTHNPEEVVHFERLTTLTAMERNNIKSSGYVIDTLEAVYWSLLQTDSYEDAVKTAVHLGDDTDTVGALTGGLAGILYGYDTIQKSWLEPLAKQKEIHDIIQRFEKGTYESLYCKTDI